jgi:hypothetical protein
VASHGHTNLANYLLRPRAYIYNGREQSVHHKATKNMANKKTVMVAAVAALLLFAVALAPPASAMDCKAGCAELKDSPLGGAAADCEKKCAEIAASKGGRDPWKDSKWDIP